MARITLSLAGITFDVTYDDAESAFVDARFGPYRTDGHADAITLRIEHDPSTRITQPASIRYPGAALIASEPQLVFERRDLRLVCDRTTRTAVATIAEPPVTRGQPVQQPTSLDTPLRLLLSVFLAERDGLLIHATGFADERGAVVMPASGGTGKTTTACKLPDESVLSDDQVAVVRTPHGWEAHALPFVGLWGKQTTPRAAPLRAIAFLAKSTTPTLTPLRPADALARLLACTVEFRTGPETAATLDRTTHLATTVPAYELALDRETPVLTYVDELLRR